MANSTKWIVQYIKIWCAHHRPKSVRITYNKTHGMLLIYGLIMTQSVQQFKFYALPFIFFGISIKTLCFPVSIYLFFFGDNFSFNVDVWR